MARLFNVNDYRYFLVELSDNMSDVVNIGNNKTLIRTNYWGKCIQSYNIKEENFSTYIKPYFNLLREIKESKNVLSFKEINEEEFNKYILLEKLKK